ncbi:MAG: hypothetical protein MUC29_07135, partial [Pyrinomonadaceae bacterium]|nr:hypothetical protein [Pyrinomonadaceae bacterium]
YCTLTSQILTKSHLQSSNSNIFIVSHTSTHQAAFENHARTSTTGEIKILLASLLTDSSRHSTTIP